MTIEKFFSEAFESHRCFKSRLFATYFDSANYIGCHSAQAEKPYEKDLARRRIIIVHIKSIVALLGDF